ncbi:MAG: hypothetical protein ACLKAL_08685 [Alkaliphilus sp.]
MTQNLDCLPPEEIYQLLLHGKIKRFPLNFWNSQKAEERAAKVTIHLFEKVLQWNKEEIKERASRDIFVNHKLRTLLFLYRNSPRELIQNAYPQKFKDWEFKKIRVSKGFWTKETGIEATKWLFEEKLKWTEAEIKKQLTYREFHKHNLTGMLITCFNGSVFEAINSSYPQYYIKERELKSVTQNYWTKETLQEAIKWLIEEELKWTEEEVREKLNTSVFIKHKLYPALLKIYEGKVSTALKDTYPGKY